MRRPFIASFPDQIPHRPYAVSIVRDEMNASPPRPSPARKSRPHQRQIETSRRLRQQAQIAGMFAQEEFTGRYAKTNYFKTYRDKFRALTRPTSSAPPKGSSTGSWCSCSSARRG